MSVIATEPYVITLTPGGNHEDAAARCARYIVNRWLPGNAGSVHLMVTPRLAGVLLTIYRQMEEPTRIRVTVQNNIPNLELL